MAIMIPSMSEVNTMNVVFWILNSSHVARPCAFVACLATRPPVAPTLPSRKIKTSPASAASSRS